MLSTGGESPNMRCVEDRQTKITKKFLQRMKFEKAPALILNRIGKGSCETHGKRSRI